MTSEQAAMEQGAPATSGVDRVASRAHAFWISGWATALLLMLWSRYLHVGFLGSAAVTFALAAILWRRGRSGFDESVLRPLRICFAILFAALLVGVAAHSRFEIIEYRWQSMELKREAAVSRSLEARMTELEARARVAATQAAVIGRDTISAARLLDRLDTLQQRSRVDGIAILSNTGELVGWAGTHRGPIPDRVRTQSPRVYFAERALFSYLYYSIPVQGVERHAVAAVLLETGSTGDVPRTGFAASFRDQVDAQVTFHAGHPGMGGKAIWSLLLNGDTIVHARVVPVTQAQRRHQAEVLPRGVMMVLTLLAYSFLGAAWIRFARLRDLKRARGLPLLGVIPFFATAPLGQALGLQGAFSPMLFVLPAWGDVTLGSLLAVAVPILALTASMPQDRDSLHGRRYPLFIAALIAGGAFALCIDLLLMSAMPGLLEGGRALWLGLQVLGTLVLTFVGALLFSVTRTQFGPVGADGPAADAVTKRRQRTVARVATAAGVVTSVIASAYIVSRFNPARPVHGTAAILWAIPFACLAVGLSRGIGRSGSLARWIGAGFLAATVVIPHVWNAQAESELHAAEKELATLGTTDDAFLDYLLESFSREAVRQFDAGEDSVPLLYGTWVASGLARQPYATEIMLWSPANTQTVQLGSPSDVHTRGEDSLLIQLVDSARRSGVWELFAFTDQPHMARVMMVPLGNGEVVSVLVPPRRTLDRRFGVAFFLGGVLPAHPRLTLVEAKTPHRANAGIAWSRTDPRRCAGDACPQGWRSETLVQYPDGRYHAHLLVPVAPVRVRTARAMLMIAFDLLLLIALWAAGAAARGFSPVSLVALGRWSRSFRARITIALFFFFLIPTIVFGYVAYRALAQEVERATQLVAERAAEQAAAEFPSETNSLVEMASHTDTDVLRYHGGELIAVSSPEALELGVYGAWMPARVYRAIEAGEETSVVDVEDLGTQRLLTAYHALQASGTLAVPMPLISTDTAERQRELADVILFAALIGALLSIALSIVVGRAFAGPIARLTRASTAVGAGRLGVRLPANAPGEFGQLFESFNQMVRRLRRARSRELRTARVLAWGEMARQVAHEIKNPLTPIKLAVQHMRRAYGDRHPDFPNILESNVSQILVEIDHLSEISRAFSRYGAPPEAAGPLQSVDVAQIVREAMTLYRTGDDNLQYRERVAGDLPPVLARPGELKEVLFNLIENSRAAIEHKGTIEVNARVSDGHVYIEVVDTGSGIPAEMLPHIFDPQFSTRSSGTGLGLAIVRRIVESWGGTVEAESEPGRGTTVCVTILPADLLIVPS